MSHNSVQHDTKIKLVLLQLLLHYCFLIQDKCFALYFRMIVPRKEIFLRFS